MRGPPALPLCRIHPRGRDVDAGFLAHCSIDAAGSRLGGSPVVTGDTKVADRGKADKIFINTSEVGIVPDGVDIHPAHARPGDRILVSDPIAVHGIAIMSVREGLEFETEIASDTASLAGLVETMLAASKRIHVLRDPTRGGVTSALSEIARSAGVGMMLDEAAIPVTQEVQGACEILGLDPLYVANEGNLLAIVSPGETGRVLRDEVPSARERSQRP